MARPGSQMEHAGVAHRNGKADPRGVAGRSRKGSRGRAKLTWGAAGIAVEGDMTVEVDEAMETDAWELSVDMPACYVRTRIDGERQLKGLLEFLGMSAPRHPVGPVGEFRLGRTGTCWVWDAETPGRLFLWVNRAAKHSVRVELSGPQVQCIRAALADATTTG
jgi:hypothetical protein